MPELIRNTWTSVKTSVDSDVLIKVDKVGKKFCRDLKKSLWYGAKDIVAELTPRKKDADRHSYLRPLEFWAVDDVSFELRRGECLGLIGRNGAGKTTLLKMLNGLIKPDKGRIEMRGRVGALIALGAGFNPILTGRENIYVNASVLGLSKKEINNKLEEIIDFADIGEFIDSPVQSYSSGMRVRLGFSIATALDPDVLLLDEVLAVGDVAFRSKCYQRIGQLLSKCAVVFVSHDEVQMSRLCDYCLYMRSGNVAALGISRDVLGMYFDDNKSIKSEPSIILHPSIKNFKCSLSDSNIIWGNLLEVAIEIDFEEKLVSGLALLNLKDGEVTVAQADFTDLLTISLQSKCLIRVSLGPIHLKEGDYSLAITVLNESKKGTIIHAVNCAYVSIRGPKGYGAVYQIPSSKVEL